MEPSRRVDTRGAGSLCGGLGAMTQNFERVCERVPHRKMRRQPFILGLGTPSLLDVVGRLGGAWGTVGDRGGPSLRYGPRSAAPALARVLPRGDR